MSEAALALQHAVEQFYYREARLLDGRQYQQWLALCAPDIHYLMPARTNPMVDNALRGREEMLGVERELEGLTHGSPLRDERLLHLTMRVERATKPNAWAENPPARTRRIVGNVEVEESGDGDELSATSAFHLHYSRPGSGSFVYAGQRRDTLRRQGGREERDFRIARRVVVMDLAEIEVPTLGLIL